MKLLNPAAGVLLGASLLALPPSNAPADDDTGLYFGFSVSRLSADFEDQDDVDFDDSDNAGGIQLGYMFNNLIGAELGYLDLGSYSSPGDNAGNRLNLDADGFSAALVLNFEVVDELDIFIKAGAFRIDAESRSTAASLVLNQNEDSTEAFGAIGFKADLGAWNFFAELSKIDTDVSELTIDIATLGLRYEFGY